MEFQNPLAIKPKTTFYVSRADELHDLPHLLPIPGLFSARLSGEVLIEALRHGPLPVGQFEALLPGTVAYHAKQAGLPRGTIFRAKKTLQIPSTQIAKGWIWTLPPTIPTLALSPASTEPTPHPETCASDPQNDAQVLIPPTPATPPTPSSENPRTCPTPATDAPTSPTSRQRPNPDSRPTNPQVPDPQMSDS